MRRDADVKTNVWVFALFLSTACAKYSVRSAFVVS